jgi:hypothetical protein
LITFDIGDAHLNPSQGMDVCLRLRVVLSVWVEALCEGLIPRPKQSYQMSKQLKKPPICEAAKVLQEL